MHVARDQTQQRTFVQNTRETTATNRFNFKEADKRRPTESIWKEMASGDGRKS